MVVGPVGGAQIQKSEKLSGIGEGAHTARSGDGKEEGALLTIDRVENSSLAERLLILSRRVAAVIAMLMTADTVVWVCLIWLSTGIRSLHTGKIGDVQGYSSRRTWKRGV